MPLPVPRAALIYALSVFALGFAFGAPRTILLAPRVGELPAVMTELPFMLLASWLIARRLVRAPALAPLAARAAMGLLAFALLMVAELALGVWGFGQTPGQWLAALGRPPGALGLAGQVVFGVMPVLARKA